MRARGSKSGVKNETPKLPETREYLGKIGIFLLLNSDFPHTKIQFSSTAFRFLQRLSNFFNGFLIFLNGFPIFKKYKKIYLRWQVYERSLFELRISQHLLPKLRNSR
jgi:hypothetical protein